MQMRDMHADDMQVEMQSALLHLICRARGSVGIHVKYARNHGPHTALYRTSYAATHAAKLPTTTMAAPGFQGHE